MVSNVLHSHAALADHRRFTFSAHTHSAVALHVAAPARHRPKLASTVATALAIVLPHFDYSIAIATLTLYND